MKELSTKVTSNYQVKLRFEAVQLPPVTDILVLGKKYPQGKNGVKESFRFLAPDEFEIVDIKAYQNPDIETVFIHKRILRRIPSEEIIKILSLYVFPKMGEEEAINVSFSVSLFCEGIHGDTIYVDN